MHHQQRGCGVGVLRDNLLAVGCNAVGDLHVTPRVLVRSSRHARRVCLQRFLMLLQQRHHRGFGERTVGHRGPCRAPGRRVQAVDVQRRGQLVHGLDE